MELKIPPVVQLMIAASVMWLIARFMEFGTFHFHAQPLVAVTLLAGALGIALAAILTFRTARTTVDPMNPERASAMVNRGIFRYSRNPMYLGLLLLLLALAVLLGNALNLLVLAGVTGFITRFQIRPEEKALEQRFGEKYLRYKTQTRRWF